MNINFGQFFKLKHIKISNHLKFGQFISIINLNLKIILKLSTIITYQSNEYPR